MGGESLLLFEGALARRSVQHPRNLRRHRPPFLRVRLGRDREAHTTDGMTVPMIMFEAKPELGGGSGGRGLLQRGQEKMTLTELRANGPAGLGVPIDGMFGAV